MDRRAYLLLKQTIRHVKTDRSFQIDAAVVLHDHLHMIWTLPPGDTDYSGRWSKIKGSFTRQWLAAGDGEAPITKGKRRDERRGVWQPKFIEHTIRDEDDFIRHVEYIHYNPVKHGYVSCPKYWPWSSFHRYVRNGVYPPSWCCLAKESTQYVERLDYKGLE